MRARADESFIKAERLHSRTIIADGMAGHKRQHVYEGPSRKVARVMAVEAECVLILAEEREKQSASGACSSLFMFAQPWVRIARSRQQLCTTITRWPDHERIERALLVNPFAQNDQMWQARTNSRPLNPAVHGIGRTPTVKAEERLFFVRRKPFVTCA